ncbi:1651_t:CDS:1, partial [Gigaspora margarita]
GTPNSTIPTKEVTLTQKKVHQIRNTNDKKNTNSEAELNNTNNKESTISDERRYTE